MKKQIIANGQSIRYSKHEGNDTRKETFVFLHGWGGDSSLWFSILPYLEPMYGSALLVDLPGFGASENPHLPFTANDYANTVIDFFHKTGIQNSVVFGHSFGCRVALRVAREQALVSALVLSNSAGIRTHSARNKILSHLTPAFRWLPEKAKRSVYKHIGSDYRLFPELGETFKNIAREDDSKIFENTKTKTLLLWGEDDMITPLSSGHTINSLIENSTLKVIKGAGHWCFSGNEEVWAGYVREFLAYNHLIK